MSCLERDVQKLLVIDIRNNQIERFGTADFLTRLALTSWLKALVRIWPILVKLEFLQSLLIMETIRGCLSAVWIFGFLDAAMKPINFRKSFAFCWDKKNFWRRDKKWSGEVFVVQVLGFTFLVLYTYVCQILFGINIIVPFSSFCFML